MEPLLTESEVSELTGIPRQSLRKMRWAGTSIPYVKIGRRVRYSQESLREYLAGCQRRSTSDQVASHVE